MEITRQQYNEIDAVNFSLLKLYLKSPAHFRYAYVKGLEQEEQDKETKALRLGKAIHSLVLEPKKFAENYVYVDFEDRPVKVGKTGAVADYRTKENKVWKEMMLEHYRGMGLSVLDSKEEFEEIQAIGHSVATNKAASQLLSGCENEQYIVWTDKETGVKCKAIVDFKNVEKSMHGDLKSMEDASPEAFGKYMANWLTHMQLAFYGDGLEELHGKPFDRHFVIAVEKKAPYVCQPFFIDEAAIEVGRTMYRSLLNLHKKCVESQTWGGYDVGRNSHEGVLVSALPVWAHNQAENNILLQNN